MKSKVYGGTRIIETLVSELSLKGVFEVGASKGIRGIEGLPPGRGLIYGDAETLGDENIPGIARNISSTKLSPNSFIWLFRLDREVFTGVPEKK